MKEFHLIILWERARTKEKEIVADIHKRFRIKRCYEITWTKELVSANFSRFYGTNLPINSHKEKECGIGPFKLLIVESDDPKYEERMTSKGLQIVNTNLFDAKTLYRQWTDGGHKIHATNTVQETNHDISLLLGKNIIDFLKEYPDPWNGETIKLKRDISGAIGWNSIHELFYILNNTINYVVLRGKTELQTNNFSENHRDVDLLIEDIEGVKYILNGTEPFNTSRPHILVNIEGYDYYLDLWESKRLYFDPVWMKRMFENRVLIDNFFYALDSNNYYYTLLYHCILFKGRIAEIYKPLLSEYSETNGLDKNNYNEVLLSFIITEGYSFTKPKDEGITLNAKGVIKEYLDEHGLIIKYDVKNEYIKNFRSRVYEKKDSYIKIGTNWLINNEAKYLEILSGTKLVPQILNKEYIEDKDETKIEISRIKGTHFNIYFKDVAHQNRKYLVSFIVNILDLLKILAAHNIAHRDLMPNNIIIDDISKKCKVGIIDFGWSTDLEKAGIERPKYLAGHYSTAENHTDAFSVGILLWEYWSDLPYVRIISKMMRNITDEDLIDTRKLIKKYNRIMILALVLFTPYDGWRLFCRKHLRIGWTFRRMKFFLFSKLR